MTTWDDLKQHLATLEAEHKADALALDEVQIEHAKTVAALDDAKVQIEALEQDKADLLLALMNVKEGHCRRCDGLHFLNEEGYCCTACQLGQVSMPYQQVQAKVAGQA